MYELRETRKGCWHGGGDARRRTLWVDVHVSSHVLAEVTETTRRSISYPRIHVNLEAVWYPSNRQWIVIWGSVTLALVVAPDTPPLAVAIVIIGALLVWQMQKPPAQMQPPPGPFPVNIYCGECGSPMSADWKHCPECGAESWKKKAAP